MRALFLEDDATMVTLLPDCAEGTSFSMIDVVTTPAALAGRLPRGHRYDVLVIDWVLHAADGLDVARGLRSAGDLTPIVLVSAAGPEHFAELEAAAATMFRCAALRKPYDMVELGEVALRLLPRG